MRQLHPFKPLGDNEPVRRPLDDGDRGVARGPFDHLRTLNTELGTFEHARWAQPRREHGFCTDDAARVVIVALNARPRSTVSELLAERSIEFVIGAVDDDGRVRNRRTVSGEWADDASTDDCWGRTVHALALASTAASTPQRRQQCRASLDRLLRHRPPSRRTLAFAALGLVELAVADQNSQVQDLAEHCAATIATEPVSPDWPWPEPFLSYANATLPDAMMALSTVMVDPPLLDRGLTMLQWLLHRNSGSGHLSVTAAGGSTRSHRPRFDQQPIEVAALADACWRAFELTGDDEWARGIERCVAWYDGDNDTGDVMWDPLIGGSYDGLTESGPNLNQGAESTIALISTRQRYEQLLHKRRQQATNAAPVS